MGNSLQDQLRALGLAKVRDKDKASTTPKQKAQAGGGRRAADPGRSRQRAKPHSATPANPDNISLEQAWRIREQEEKTAKQRARELKLEEDRKRAAINKQIRALVDAHRLNLADASEARYFMYKERIRKVYASAEQLAGLNDGSLGVVYLAGGYHILSAEHAEAVRQISAEHVADLLSGSSEDDELWAAYENEAAAGQGEPAANDEPPAKDS